jgi:predicted heme/steroid binding protein
MDVCSGLFAETEPNTMMRRFKRGFGFIGSSAAWSSSPSDMVASPGSLSVDGVDEYVRIPHSSGLNITGEITVAIWTTTTDTTNNTGMIAKSNYTENKRCWGVETYNNGANLGVMLAAADGTSAKFYTGNSIINDGIPHLVGFTLDASPFDFTIYVDNTEQTVVKVTDLTFNDLRQDATVDVTIGSLLSGSNPALPIEAVLHRPIIINKKLSSVEWAELYGAGVGFENISDLSFAANVVASYRFSAADTLAVVRDESGNNNHGSYNGELADFVDTVPAVYSAISFNGTDERVAIPHSTSLNLSSAATVFFCYKYSDASVGQRDAIFLSKSDYGANKRSWFVEKYVSDASRIGVFLSDDGGNNRKVYYTAAGQNTDGHASFAWTWGSSTLTLYKNGADIMASVTKATDTAMTNLYQNTDVGVLIGAIYNSGTPALHCNATIDRVLIFNTALNSTEIGQLHAAVFAQDDLTALSFWSSNVLNQALDSGTSFPDLSGNSNNGTGANLDASNVVRGVY